MQNNVLFTETIPCEITTEENKNISREFQIKFSIQDGKHKIDLDIIDNKNKNPKFHETYDLDALTHNKEMNNDIINQMHGDKKLEMVETILREIAIKDSRVRKNIPSNFKWLSSGKTFSDRLKPVVSGYDIYSYGIVYLQDGDSTKMLFVSYEKDGATKHTLPFSRITNGRCFKESILFILEDRFGLKDLKIIQSGPAIVGSNGRPCLNFSYIISCGDASELKNAKFYDIMEFPTGIIDIANIIISNSDKNFNMINYWDYRKSN